MKRTWKRFAVLAGCAALSLVSGRVQAEHHRPVSAYQCPHLERQKCERTAAEVAQIEPAPGEAATPVDSNAPTEQTFDYEAGVGPSDPSNATEPSSTPAVENSIPAAAVEQVAPQQDASELVADPAGSAGNIVVFELNDKNEGLEPAEIATEIDYEAEVAREAIANDVLNQIGEAMRQSAEVLDIANFAEPGPAVDTNDPAPVPPAELTDAAPVAVEPEAESVVVVAQPVADQPAESAEIIVEPARAVEAALVAGDKDDWSYARWLASELVGELNRLAIHEAGELAKSAGASIQDLVENGTVAEEATAIEVVAEPESQPAPESAATVNLEASPESTSPESAVGVTATVQEIPVAEPVTENAQSKENVLSQPAREESSDEFGESDESAIEESKPTSFLPETLEDFENGYSIPDLFY